MAKSKYDYDLPPHKVERGIEVKLSELIVDENAQRSYNVKRARDLGAHFIPEAAGELTISKRADGTMALVDGQHRSGAAQFAGLETLPAEIHHGLTVPQEAQLFLLKNREASKPLKFDEYKVGLTAEHPLYVDIETELSRLSLHVGHTTAHQIGAVGALEGIVLDAERAGMSGRYILMRTLTVAEAAWGRTAETWDGMLIGGLGMFIIRHPAAMDEDTQRNGAQGGFDALARKLGKSGPAYQWRGRVMAAASAESTQQTGTSNRRSAAYRLILATWNKGRRTKLAA